MNIFGLGGMELLVILVIMLIVAGPKRMLHWAYILGKWMGQLRIMWRQMMKELQKEFDEAGVGIKLPEDLPTRSDIQRIASQAIRPVAEPMEQTMKEVEADAKAVNSSYKKASQRLDDSLRKGLSLTNGSSPARTVPTDLINPPEKPADKPSFGTWSGSAGKTEDQES